MKCKFRYWLATIDLSTFAFLMIALGLVVCAALESLGWA